jgi:hypothetical protein
MPIGGAHGRGGLHKNKFGAQTLALALGVLRPRALILHMTLWTKTKDHKKNPKIVFIVFIFLCTPHLAYFAERMGTRGIRAGSNGICVRGARKG